MSYMYIINGYQCKLFLMYAHTDIPFIKNSKIQILIKTLINNCVWIGTKTLIWRHFYVNDT